MNTTIWILFGLSAALNFFGAWVMAAQARDCRRYREQLTRLSEVVEHHYRLSQELQAIAKDEEEYANSRVDDAVVPYEREGIAWLRRVRADDQ